MRPSIRDSDPAKPYAREAETFPLPINDAVERMAAYGTNEHLAPGTMVFAIGEVRSGSIMRVAAAVGERSVVVHATHQVVNADDA